MLIKAEQKFIRMSPTKLRFVANGIRKMDPDRAVSYLAHIDKRASLPLQKTIKQALANARNNLNVTDLLIFRELSVGEGPTFKRGHAASRGRYHAIHKKTAHIRVILETVAAKKVVSEPTQAIGEVKKVEKVKSAKKGADKE